MDVQTDKSCRTPLTFSMVGIMSIAWSSAKPPSLSCVTLAAKVCLTFAKISLKCCFKLCKWLRHCFRPAFTTRSVPIL